MGSTWRYRRPVLTNADVVPFWAHPVPSVRQFATSFLNSAGDESAIDADEWYQALERYPREDHREPPWGATYSPKSLARKALELIEVRYWYDDRGRHQHRTPVHCVDDLRLSYVMPLLSLLPRTEELQPYRARLRHRLAVSALPPERLISKVIELCDGMPDGMSDKDARYLVRPWTEALAVRGHPGEALAALTAPRQSDRGWSRFAALLLVSAARYQPAIPLMLEWSELEDGFEDVYRFNLNSALAAVDTEATVTAIRETYYLGTEAKFHGASLLGGFRRPSAEALLLELLDHEQDLDARSWLINALCDMGTTEGLERLRPLKEGVDYSRQWTEYLDRSIAIIERILTRDPAVAASLEADIRQSEEDQLRQHRLDYEAGLYG